VGGAGRRGGGPALEERQWQPNSGSAAVCHYAGDVDSGSRGTRDQNQHWGSGLCWAAMGVDAPARPGRPVRWASKSSNPAPGLLTYGGVRQGTMRVR
jgi:hypothetical protein